MAWIRLPLSLSATLLLGAAQSIQNPLPQILYNGIVTTRTNRGNALPVRLSIQVLRFQSKPAPQNVLPRGFFVAHLVSGSILTTISGESPRRRAVDSFWTVKSGAQMAVTVSGEVAILQIITASR